jgi:hypothetical protein
MDFTVAYSALSGALIAVVALLGWQAYQKEAPARALRRMVRSARSYADLRADGDPVAAAKREAELEALLKQAQAAVAELK